jgi:hypothetical protein
MDSLAAKQFLITRVLEEASCEHVQLSEVEQKMLHFTEDYPSLPDIYEVASDFQQNYASDEYENKIAALLTNARSRDEAKSESRAQVWKDALTVLSKADHYILVMTNQAFRPIDNALASPNHRVRDLLIYIAVGLSVVIVLILFASYK